MDWKRITLIIAAVVIVLISWLGRYQIIGISDGSAYRLDRWTGEVVLFDGEEAYVTEFQ